MHEHKWTSVYFPPPSRFWFGLCRTQHAIHPLHRCFILVFCSKLHVYSSIWLLATGKLGSRSFCVCLIASCILGWLPLEFFFSVFLFFVYSSQSTTLYRVLSVLQMMLMMMRAPWAHSTDEAGRGYGMREQRQMGDDIKLYANIRMRPFAQEIGNGNRHTFWATGTHSHAVTHSVFFFNGIQLNLILFAIKKVVNYRINYI